MTTNEEMLGRADVNDLEAILSITAQDVEEMVHSVKDNADAIFTWNYEKGERPALNKLYEKAKGAQWNGETDLPWHLDVDIEKLRPTPRGQDPPRVRLRPASGQRSTMERQGVNSSSSNRKLDDEPVMPRAGRPRVTAKSSRPSRGRRQSRRHQGWTRPARRGVRQYLEPDERAYPLNVHAGSLLDIIDTRAGMTYLGSRSCSRALASPPSLSCTAHAGRAQAMLLS